MRTAHVGLLAIALLLLGGSSGEGSVSATDITGLLREFGFPIFVSLWFMWRLEKRLDAFTESIQKLLTVITVMSKTVDELSSKPPRKAGVGHLGESKDAS